MAQEEALSFAVYRLIKHRFRNAPFAFLIEKRCDSLMINLGYNIHNTSEDYLKGSAELGNYIAQQLIEYGLQDGSNEVHEYSTEFYIPINPLLIIENTGNPVILNLNWWQPLKLKEFIDQAGNPALNGAPEFLSPEWGSVNPFALQEKDASFFERYGNEYKVYHDPGLPCRIQDADSSFLQNNYKWGNTLVAVWSSHLNPENSTL